MKKGQTKKAPFGGIELAITGYFGRNDATFKHELPDPSEASKDLGSPVVSGFPSQSRTLKSHVVSCLRNVASGELRGDYEGKRYAEASGFIRPVEFVQDHPFFGDVKFDLTAQGQAFLNSHEAPVEW